MIDASHAANLTLTVVSSDVSVLPSSQNILIGVFLDRCLQKGPPRAYHFLGVPLLLGASARPIVDASSVAIDTGSLRIQ